MTTGARQDTTILVVEDNPITRKVLRVALQTAGYTVVEAGDGAGALELSRRHGPGLIIQDLRLPDIDGIELVRRLRLLPMTRDIPILAFSGLQSKVEEARSLQAGFTDYLFKPVEPSRLLAIVNEYLRRPASDVAMAGLGRRVLLVDDDPVQLKLQRLHLERSGFVVTTAADGIEALDAARSAPPDVIVTDLIMPRLGGLDLCLAVRRDPAIGRTPVVLTSSTLGSVADSDRDLAEKVGANSFVLRTPDSTEMVRHVLAALASGAAPAPGSGKAAGGAGYSDALMQQLERQTELNQRLLRRAVLQAAQSSVLTGVSEVLSRSRSPHAAIHEILARVLDASGTSVGAIFLAESDGALTLSAVMGAQSEGSVLENFYGHPELLSGSMQAARALLLPSPEAGAAGDAVLERAGCGSMVVVPLHAPEGPQGVIVISSDREGLEEPWIESVTVIASQLGQAVLLARTLERLTESEQRYRGLFNGVPIGVYRIAQGGRFLEANAAMLRLLGHSSIDSLLATRLPDHCVLDEDRRRWDAMFDAAGAARSLEVRMRRRDGSVIWVRHTARSILDESGAVESVEGSAEDITERRQAEDAMRRNYSLLNAVIENTPDAIFVKDEEGRYLMVNSADARLLERPAEQIVGRTDAELFPEAQARSMAAIDREILQSGQTRTAEQDFTVGDERRTYLTSRGIYRDSEGRAAGVFGIAREITERKRAEEALAERARLAALVADVGLALTRAEPLGQVLQRCAEAVVRHLGAAFARIWTVDAAAQVLELQASAGMYTHLDGAHSRVPIGQFKIGRIAQERRPHLTNAVLDDPLVSDRAWAQREGMVAFAGHPLVVEDRVIGVLAMFSRMPLSVTVLQALETVADEIALGIVRKLNDAALLESEERFRELASHVREVFFVQNSDFSEVLYVSPAYEQVWGRSCESLVADPLSFLADIVAEDRPAMVARMEMSRAGVDPGPVDFRIDPGDGTVRWIRARATPIIDAGGAVRRIVGVASDVTEQKLAERALRDSEAQYRLLFESNPNPMWVYDRGTLLFLAVNDAAITHYGYSRDEFLAMTIRDIRPEAEIARLTEWLQTNATPRLTPEIWRHQKRDGIPIDVEIIGSEITFAGRSAELVLAQDITARRQLEDQFRQAQKMEAVGRLAGGVAHDFNNLLTAIMGYSELLLGDVAPADPRREDLAEIIRAAERAAGLTRQLLAFSRQQVLEPRVLDLNDVVAQLSKLLHRVLGEDIDLSLELAPGLGAVRADPGQLEQVLVNCAVNSRDSMPDGGKLTIETRDQYLDEELAHAQQPIPPGSYVLMAITDTGSGMDEVTKRRAFEPFFTTKEPGKGTGLGLSTVYGIVSQSGGHILLDSEPGRGTSFKIYLPRIDEALEETERTGSPGAGLVPSGTETILLVEDEEAVRKLAAEVLARRGYHVLVSSNAEEALAASERHDGSIHLLITDLVMPGLRGSDLADRILAARPACRVLYMSGYAPEAVMHHGIIHPGRTFIGKPFGPAQFIRKVRAVLDPGDGEADG